MIRVLQVVHSLKIGGIQSYLMNVYRNIDRDKIQFDFLIFDAAKGEFEEEILRLGGIIYRLPSRRVSWTGYKKGLLHFFIEHKEYKCVHVHRSNLSDIEPLKAAKRANIPVRIIHSHSTSLPKGFIHILLHRINRRKLGALVTDYYACSEIAGEWLFTGTPGARAFIIINNGIPVNDYVFNADIRNKYRQQLGLNNELVFANVGRMSEAKNHEFLIRLYKELLVFFPESKLFIVGDGDLMSETKDQVKRYGIEDKVVFLGTRRDVAQILQAVDCILMPSKWEGFPVSLIEEQASGLPCYVSDSVTIQAKINDNVIYISLTETESKWAQIISETLPALSRYPNGGRIKESGFDVASTVAILEEKYISAHKD